MHPGMPNGMLIIAAEDTPSINYGGVMGISTAVWVLSPLINQRTIGFP